jgi:transcriptional regulator GlxA family with amidase domain
MKILTCAAFLAAALLGAGCKSGGSTSASDGACCGDAKPAALKAGAKNVGILVFDDLFITEFVAPFDVYKHVTDNKMNVFSVSPKGGTIKTYEGVVMHADYSFANSPKIDILVVPSGNGSTSKDLEDKAFLDFVRKSAAGAEYVTSHCWGGFTLAAAGLLDGKECTTFPTSVDDLQKKFPAVRTKKDARFVVTGKIVTSNGGLAAFEAALYVVEKLYGKEMADKVAAGLVYAPDNRKFAGGSN